MNIREEQRQLWNGAAGRAWVDAQETLDAIFQPFAELLVSAVAAHGGRQVLDIGCGAGATTLALSRMMPPDGCSLGVDISEPLIAAATERAGREGSRARFVAANAQTYAFAPGTFDTIVSRFGVMFFDDPIAAFANLRRAACAGAALQFISWRSAAENPFMTTAERAAAPLLPGLPERRVGGPGQFAFADPGLVTSVLEASGWSDVVIRPIDVTCRFAAVELEGYFLRLGPVGLALREADEETRARVVPAVRAAFAPYVEGGEVRFSAACWMVSGRAI